MIDLFARLKKMRIMLIDDDIFIRDAMTTLFEGEGCKLTALESAEEALVELEQQFYDIIITDYRLPGIDGLQFLERIRESQRQAMKVFMTAYGGQAINLEAARLGAKKVIEKPFTTNTMEEALVQMIAVADQKRQTRKVTPSEHTKKNDHHTGN